MARHDYMKRPILSCSYVESREQGYRWYVPSVHPATGIPYGETDSPRYRSLAAAREAIREQAEMAAEFLGHKSPATTRKFYADGKR